jgi:DNA invertase Pin-like site-specific DNA recombinase
MLIGYARISTDDQALNLQCDAVTAAGCERIFAETASGAKRADGQSEPARASPEHLTA